MDYAYLGHRSSSGTYLDNLGYYYVINDYSDYTFLFDIQDKKGIIANHEYRYKIRSGESWYNYILEGYNWNIGTSGYGKIIWLIFQIFFQMLKKLKI